MDCKGGHRPSVLVEEVRQLDRGLLRNQYQLSLRCSPYRTDRNSPNRLSSGVIECQGGVNTGVKSKEVSTIPYDTIPRIHRVRYESTYQNKMVLYQVE